MAVQCRKCGKQYDITLFQFGNTVICDCGGIVEATGIDGITQDSTLGIIGQLEKEFKISQEDENVCLIQRMANKICFLILHGYPKVDIEIEKGKLREKCIELFPDKEQLYEMIYGSRFRRIWEQFRKEG